MPEKKNIDGIRLSMERISRWMNEHGARLLVENLAPATTEERLAEAEVEFGMALPSDLRTLWSLHDGQREDGNGFIEAYNLLSVKWALADRETVLMSIEFARESPDWWKNSGGTQEELHSNHWLPFAAQDSDALVVNGLTGRVFQFDHDDLPKLLAPSLEEWFQRYADRVEADDYEVEEGFGDYYLCLRDREFERRLEERARRQAEHEQMRREVPLLEQFHEAIAKSDEDRCIEVLEDAIQRDDKDAFNSAVALLFNGSIDLKLVARALRPLLNAVTLTPDQWVDVAEGGALIGNNAIRDVSLSHAAGRSIARLNRLEKVAAAASSSERDALEIILERLGGRRLKWTPKTGPVGKGGSICAATQARSS
jgi:cell wall assembly regulator SMI1